MVNDVGVHHLVGVIPKVHPKVDRREVPPVMLDVVVIDQKIDVVLRDVELNDPGMTT